MSKRLPEFYIIHGGRVEVYYKIEEDGFPMYYVKVLGESEWTLSTFNKMTYKKNIRGRIEANTILNLLLLGIE